MRKPESIHEDTPPGEGDTAKESLSVRSSSYRAEYKNVFQARKRGIQLKNISVPLNRPTGWLRWHENLHC